MLKPAFIHSTLRPAVIKCGCIVTTTANTTL
jgi:hypothetical protein